jgi:hypothetical protein
MCLAACCTASATTWVRVGHTRGATIMQTCTGIHIRTA